MEKAYTVLEVSRLTGADYHNVLYWLRSGLIRASLSPDRQPKPRHPALFSFTDLLEIAIIQELRARGAPVQRIRKALDYLKSLGPDYVSLFHLGAALPPELRRKAVYLDVSGEDIHVYHSDKEAISAVKKRGQLIVHALMLDVKRFRREIEQRLSLEHEASLATRS